MAEPGFLDLRSDLRFGAGSAREAILSAWGEGLRSSASTFVTNAEVTQGSAVPKVRSRIQLATGETIQAAAGVVLAIGLEGNPRKLGAPGE